MCEIKHLVTSESRSECLCHSVSFEKYPMKKNYNDVKQVEQLGF